MYVRFQTNSPSSELEVVPRSDFAHCDFFMASDAGELVYSSIIRRMDKMLPLDKRALPRQKNSED